MTDSRNREIQLVQILNICFFFKHYQSRIRPFYDSVCLYLLHSRFCVGVGVGVLANT